MMTRAAPPLLLDLQQPTSLPSLVASLRTLKNDIIGHDQRKEAWVGWGIIPVLSQLLTARQPANGKRAAAVAGTESNGVAKRREVLGPRSDEDAVALQAIILVGSLAQGGPAFLPPIFASNIVPALLSILSAPDCPSFLSLPILRTLNTIADRLALQSEEQLSQGTRLADLLFTKKHIHCLTHIIGQDYGSHHTQLSISLAASLIGKLCAEEPHKAALAEAGVLDALAVKIGSFVVAQGFVLPSADDSVHASNALGALPLPAPRAAPLAPILRAVAAILEHSKWRAEHFLSSPGIMAVFPKQVPEFAPHDVKKGPWGSTYLSGSAVPRHAGGHPLNSLLPTVPLSHSKGSAAGSTNFPPLGPAGAQPRRHSHSFTTQFSMLGETIGGEDEENALIPWLLYMLRAEDGMVRLMAARLVTVLFRLGLAKKQRVSMFSYLLIPVLIRMLDKDYDVPEEENDAPRYEGLISTAQRLREEAPAVLATLVIDDQELQKHAVDGGAIKRLSALLKDTYRPVQETTWSIWHAETRGSPGQSVDAAPDCQLGPTGYSPVVCHIMRYRENILKALAALVPFKDEYRKAVCENGVVPFIIDSLKPRAVNSSADTYTVKNTAADGNPTATLLAACGAARMLTRSVSVLRTSLIDAGVAQPLFVLIKHPDIEVQIAATSVICNLALDFSPMKELIISADILPTLCEHARLSNTKLRIESLWALKHVAYNSTNDVKIKIIEGLTPQWLKQIITQDSTMALTKRGLTTDDSTGENGSALGMGSANAVGERIDLLNPLESAQDSEDNFKMNTADAMPASRFSLEFFLPNTARRRKLTLNSDLDQTTQARQDDIAVQEQMFDLLRNIICGTGAPEMIDYLLQAIGTTVMLDALADRLRPRHIHLPHQRESNLSTTTTTMSGGSSSSRTSLQVPTEILICVTFFIIHLAAGLPRHRQLLVSHPTLLKHLMSYFNHSRREVRTNCVWIVINLTYEDDQSDRDGCRERATKLRSVGVADRLANLADDPDLDVRERTKTAVHQLNLLSPV